MVALRAVEIRSVGVHMTSRSDQQGRRRPPGRVTVQHASAAVARGRAVLTRCIGLRRTHRRSAVIATARVAVGTPGMLVAGFHDDQHPVAAATSAAADLWGRL